MKVNIFIPTEFDENNLDKYNPKSSYYNDLCNTHTTKVGTDISLKDRKKEFVENNMTLCEEDCEFMGYNPNTKEVECECPIKINLFKITEISVNKKKLYDKFTDVKNIMNLNLMKCYKVLFTKEGIIYNIGSYIVIALVILYFISLIIFYKNDLQKINLIIEQMIYAKKKMNVKMENIETNEIQKIPEKDKVKRKSMKNITKININNQNNITKPDNKNRRKSVKINIKQNISENRRKSVKMSIKQNISAPLKKNKKIEKRKSIKHLSYPNSELRKMEFSNSLIKNEITNILKNNETEKNVECNKEIMNLNDYELNTLHYKEALEKDKRIYCQYYISLLKTNHLVFFSFVRKNDYNSKIIKIFLFFFTFILSYVVNALFFSESILMQIYRDAGKFNFIYQLPQIVYSSLISNAVNIIIKTLSLSEKNILEIKKEKNINNLEKKSIEIKNNLSIKFKIFFLFSFLFSLFFWYYISCFCAVYKNTQLHLFKDTLISFIISLIYPLFIYLIPGTFRLISLRDNKQSREIIYNFSKIIQMI